MSMAIGRTGITMGGIGNGRLGRRPTVESYAFVLDSNKLHHKIAPAVGPPLQSPSGGRRRAFGLVRTNNT